MSDYIDKEIAAKGLRMAHDYDGEAYINAIPAADVAEVRHGHWEQDDKIRCSNCGMPTADLRLEPSVVDYDQAKFAINVFAHPYCGFCGAKMDESAG